MIQHGDRLRSSDRYVETSELPTHKPGGSDTQYGTHAQYGTHEVHTVRTQARALHNVDELKEASFMQVLHAGALTPRLKGRDVTRRQTHVNVGLHHLHRHAHLS